MKLHPLNKIKIVGTLIGVLVLGIVVGVKDPGQVRASSNDNVHGWLWSDMPDGSDQCMGSEITPINPDGCPPIQAGVHSGIFGRGLGYISLNSADQGAPAGDYGVTVDAATGDFSGVGWSDYGGWLETDATGFPLAGGTAATAVKMMPSCWTDPTQTVCKVIGWMRFTAGTQPQAGGWDGWVSLNTTTSPSYGVSYNKTSKKFSGYAWGGSVAGWINFENASATILPVSNGACTDPSANNYTNPLAPGQVSDASVCTYDNDICVTDPSVCTYDFCTLHPLLCQTPTDICFSIPGDQDTNSFPMTYLGSWYGLSSGICQKDACSDTADGETSGFQAYVPFTGSNGLTYNVDPIDGVCKKQTTFIQSTTTGPIKPIYKEN